MIQFGFGAGTSVGGPLVERGEMSFEGMFARRLTHQRPWMLGVVAQRSFDNGSELTCIQQTPSAPCDPHAPRLSSVGVIGGVIREGSQFTMNALAGPSMFYARNISRIGLQARVDIAKQLAGPFFVTLSPRAMVIPNIAGATVLYSTVTLGIRVLPTSRL